MYSNYTNKLKKIMKLYYSIEKWNLNVIIHWTGIGIIFNELKNIMKLYSNCINKIKPLTSTPDIHLTTDSSVQVVGNGSLSINILYY